MTDGADDEMVAFRLARADRAAIERLVARGEYRNRSDFFRFAVKSALRDHPEARAPRLDLSMEGVELPDVGAPQGARRNARRGTQSRSRG